MQRFVAAVVDPSRDLLRGNRVPALPTRRAVAESTIARSMSSFTAPPTATSSTTTTEGRALRRSRKPPRAARRGHAVVVKASNEEPPAAPAELSRRDVFAATAALAAAIPLDRASAPFAVPAAFAAMETAGSIPAKVPAAASPLKFSTSTPSRVIKGCWQLGGGHRGDQATDRTSGAAAVEDFAAFARAGINTFDTGPEACGYGPSELIIGEALKSGTIKREDVNIYTKLCCVGREQQNMTSDWVNQKLDLPCRRLGTNKLDLVQMYWNEYNAKHYVDAALFLTDAKAAGRIGAVGLTNFDTKRVAEMVDAGAEIASNQIQFSLLDRRPEREMVPYCAKNGIALLPYGVVAGGLLSDKFLDFPGEDVVLDTSSKRKYASVLGYAGGYAWYQRLLAELRRVGDKHGGATIANVASRWVLDSNDVTPAIILGARNANHVDDHRAMFAFELDDDDKASIRGVLNKGKAPSADCYTYERGGPW